MRLRSILRWVDPLIDVRRLVRFPQNFWRYFRDCLTYKMAGGEMALADLWPIFSDWTTTTGYDRHYTYLNVWAFEKIKNSPNVFHVDIGSQIGFVTLLSTVKDVTFIDIRPLEIKLDKLHNQYGSVLSLPFADRSLHSISSLHVIEHIGLGRYGDPVDPKGTAKAISELSRVLAPGGDLYVAVPTGVSRTCFNAHRIMNPLDVVTAFASEGIRLRDFCIVTDQGDYLIDVNPENFADQQYGCGMFHFTKTAMISD